MLLCGFTRLVRALSASGSKFVVSMCFSCDAAVTFVYSFVKWFILVFQLGLGWRKTYRHPVHRKRMREVRERECLPLKIFSDLKSGQCSEPVAVRDFHLHFFVVSRYECPADFVPLEYSCRKKCVLQRGENTELWLIKAPARFNPSR